VDGLYGNAAVLKDILDTGVGIIGRSRDYALLDLAVVQAVLACPPVEVCSHPESGAIRSLYDCPDVPLSTGGPRVRLIVASHPAAATAPPIGKKRDGMFYELFVTRLPAPAFSAKDVLDLYLHRGSFETVLADEDIEQDPDRWCSHTRFPARILANREPMGVESPPGTRAIPLSHPDAHHRIRSCLWGFASASH